VKHTKYTIKPQIIQVLVAVTCNTSYSGGRDQEDYGLRPAWANSLRNPVSKKKKKQQNKKTSPLKGLVEWLKV
jgi:hypothetical protein